MHLIRLACFAAVASLALAGPAAGQSCNFGISDVSFGAVDVIAGGAVDTTATLTVNCTGVGVALRICPSIGAGSGGADAGARKLIGPGGATLDYQLYQNPARTIVWGSHTWGLPGTPPTIDLPLVLGSGATTVTVYARMFAGQSGAPAGSYSSSFTGADTDFIYANLGVLACPNLLLPQTANPTFAANAVVESNCLVSAQDIDFGAHGVLSANIDALGEVSVTCTPDTDYSVSLDGGLAAGTPTARKMSKGGEQITYALYRDSARSQPWGDTINTDTVSGTGSGSVQLYPVYARVPPQTTPSPGVYTDTIVVTVTY